MRSKFLCCDLMKLLLIGAGAAAAVVLLTVRGVWGLESTGI